MRPERMPAMLRRQAEDLEKMTAAVAQNVGTDIGKDHLDVALCPADEIKRFDNTPEGHRTLNAWLSAWPSNGSCSKPQAPIIAPSREASLPPACRRSSSTRAKPGALPK